MWMTLLGCGSGVGASVQPLQFDGTSVDVPATYVSLEPDRVERLRQAALREAPGTTVEVQALRHPKSMAHGAVYIQRSLDSAANRNGSTVREALAALEEDLRQRMVAGPVTVVSIDATDRDGGREICTQLEMGQGPRVVHLSNCVLGVVDRKHQLVMNAVSCAADAAEVCASVMATRNYATVDALPMDAALPPQQQGHDERAQP